MKKLLICMIALIIVVSLTITGVGCKGTVAEAIEEAVEEVAEAVEEVAEEVEEVAEEVEEVKKIGISQVVSHPGARQPEHDIPFHDHTGGGSTCWPVRHHW